MEYPNSIEHSIKENLSWSRKADAASSIRMITRASFDRSHTTISWLEGACSLSPTCPPVRFMTIAQCNMGAYPSTQELPCFTLSDHDIPAVYAWSTRDYDRGLGLLTVGNTIGELALFSFAGGAFNNLKNTLEPVVIPPWNGQELVSHVSMP